MACHDANCASNLDLLISFSRHVFGESQKTTARRSIHTTRERFALARTRTPCCRCELLIRTLRFGRRDRLTHRAKPTLELCGACWWWDDVVSSGSACRTEARALNLSSSRPLHYPARRGGSGRGCCFVELVMSTFDSCIALRSVWHSTVFNLVLKRWYDSHIRMKLLIE